MEDLYDPARGGTGVRMAARGADDDHSATATLLLAAPILLELSKAGRLARDVWLLHLTGEEFPADCLGARYLCEALVEQALQLQVDDRRISLAQTRVAGVFVMDMIAHNRDHARDIFQISPGRSRASLELAWQAHVANAIWPPGLRTRNSSWVATSGRGAKMWPNWLRTTSKLRSGKGRFSASPSFQLTWTRAKDELALAVVAL